MRKKCAFILFYPPIIFTPLFTSVPLETFGVSFIPGLLYPSIPFLFTPLAIARFVPFQSIPVPNLTPSFTLYIQGVSLRDKYFPNP